MNMRIMVLITMMLLGMSGATTAYSQPLSTPSPPDQASVSGDAFSFLPAGEPDSVSIIASTGPRSSVGAFSIVIRNNTDKPISQLEVKSELRDASGKLVAVGDTSVFEPNVIYPGEIGIGLSMGSMTTDTSLQVEFKISYEDGAGLDYGTDLEFIYSEWSGDRILGELLNPSDGEIEIVHLTYACFDNNGDLITVEWGSANGKLAPKNSTTFQVGEYDPNISSCNYHLITGTGL